MRMEWLKRMKCLLCAQGGGAASDPESNSGSDLGNSSIHRTEESQRKQRKRRLHGGSSKRRRATYRYEVVYRREEYTHDDEYLPHFRPEENLVPVIRHPPVAQPQLAPPPPPPRPVGSPAAALSAGFRPDGSGFRNSNYSHLANYGNLEELHPHGGWRHYSQHPSASRKLRFFQDSFRILSGLIDTLKSKLNRQHKILTVDYGLA